MIYRIWCKFNPNAKRAGGGDSMGPRQARGAWTVDECSESNTPDIALLRNPGVVGLLTAKHRRVGTRCSPRKLLAEYQAARRA